MHTRDGIRNVIGVAAAIAIVGCGGGKNQQSNGDVALPPASAPYGTTAAAPAETATVHHSALKGALVGAAAGHMLGKHALAGAAAGALIQHERNKHQ